MTDSKLYFPEDKAWERVGSDSVGWDSGRLDEAMCFAQENRSTGVVILHRGQILREAYWKIEDLPGSRYKMGLKGYDSADAPIEDVASIQKSFVALMACVAKKEGLLDFDDVASTYLGEGWTKASREQEAQITLKHLLSMNSGLNLDLEYEAPPGEKWFYNTVAYSRLFKIVGIAADTDPHVLTQTWIAEPLGMVNTRWAERPWAKDVPDGAASIGLVTTARELARLGLMVLAGGRWKDHAVVDSKLLAEALTASKINSGYGYLWWLNSDVERPVIPPAPNDLLACFGVGQKKLYVVPSLDLVVTRLGDRPDKTPEGEDFGYFNNGLWSRIMAARVDPDG